MQKKTEETGTRERREKVAKCCVKPCRQHSRFLAPHSGMGERFTRLNMGKTCELRYKQINRQKQNKEFHYPPEDGKYYLISQIQNIAPQNQL